MRLDRLILTTAILTSLAGSVCAQDILLSEDVNADTIVSEIGPNKKKFTHAYVGLGFAASPDTKGSRINYGKSFEFSVGRRIKWRVNNWYAVGLDLMYHLNSYSLKQDSGKVLPNNTIHNKERLKLHNLGVGFYNRFNYGKRGNVIGNYVDVGVRFDVPFAKSLISWDEYNLAGASNGREIETKTTNLRFIEDYNYSGYFRLGFNKFAITASYRLAPLFIKDANLYAKYNNGLEQYPDLPLINVGLEFSKL